MRAEEFDAHALRHPTCKPRISRPSRREDSANTSRAIVELTMRGSDGANHFALIRSFLRRDKAVDACFAPAAAKFFRAVNFSARVSSDARTRSQARVRSSRACAKAKSADVAETRISSAFLQCMKFFAVKCVNKNISASSLARTARRVRTAARESGGYTQY